MQASRTIRTITGLAVLLLLAPTAPAADANESNCWPGPPGSDPTLCPPNDPRFAGRWEFLGSIPDSVDSERMHPAERELGAIGFSLDLAWQLSTGRRDVIIAVLDSGIRWNYEDLRLKFHVNAGELPPPEGSKVHDANGDGRFDVDDYAGDSRVGDGNGNGLLDPEDLILAFSDCKDDDGNGYPDDISGYDFFGEDRCGIRGADNNPADDTNFGHGTGIASVAAAQTNNGIRDAGVCPECSILPVRVGDSFVVDANQFARGVIFAANTGASVVASALGSYNNTPAARAAVDFAYERGVAIIASAADEFSYHHNYPSVYNHALYVNAMRDNHARDFRKATTFWGLNPCTNFGARVWMSVPARSCSSGATSRLSGAAGLVLSAARDAGLGALHPEELYQVLRLTADDLDNTSPDWGRSRWRAKAGFDQIYGYGRLNAHRAVLAAQQGTIPPIVDLHNPDWFTIISPSKRPSVPVHGSIRLPRTERATYRLEYALGVEPRDEQYQLIARGSLKGDKQGVFGALDFTRLPLPQGAAPSGRADRDRYSVTVRLRVIDDRGLTAEARRSFFVLDDPSWKEHFPVRLPASGEATPLLVDLDGDGRDEIVLPTADGLLRILSWEPSGLRTVVAPLDERPAPLGAATPWTSAELRRETVVRGAAVGDLAGGGEQVIVVASREGKIYVFNRRGERLAPFPVEVDARLARGASRRRIVERGFLTRPVLADIDGRPGAEIIASALDGHVYAWRHDGKPVEGFPVRVFDKNAADVQLKIVSSPAVGDIDGDGKPEIVCGSNSLDDGVGGAYAIRASGNADPRGPFLEGWDPVEVPALRATLLPTIASGLQMTPNLVDVDGDGDLEVVLYAVTGTAVVLVDHGGDRGAETLARYSLAPGPGSRLRGTSFLGGTGSPLVADTDGDGKPELYAPLLPMRMLTLRTKPGVPLEVPLALGGWELGRGSDDGQPVSMLVGYPRPMEDMMLFARPFALDTDGDGTREIVMGSGGYLLHAFDRKGGEPAGFPKFTGGWIFSAAAAGDLDGDGRQELVAVTREGNLFAWELRSPSVQTRSARTRSDRSPGAGPSAGNTED